MNTTDKYEDYVFEKTEPSPVPETIADKSVIKVFYVKDANHDNIPDKYQVTVNYVATTGGSVTKAQETLTIYDADHNWATSGTVTAEGSTAQANTGYSFNKWTKSQNGGAASDTLLTAAIGAINLGLVNGGDIFTFTAYFTKQNASLSVDKTVVSVGGVAVTNQYRLPSAVVGQLIRYQIVVKNTGNVTLDNVTVSDKLWEKGTEITVDGSKYTLNGSQFSIGSLAPEAEIVITYSYRATLKDSVYGYVKNGVTVTSDNGPTTSDEVTIKVYPIVIPDVPADNTPNWLNTEDHYAYIVGYNDGTVKPNNNITRAEVATIFFRLLTDDARAYYWSTDSGFSDVKPGDWYNNAVATMVNAGILTGYSDGTFKPNANITRAEFATIAARFLSNSYSLNDRFYDTEGHWAEPYINRAAEVGWINGYSDGSFKPDRAITRAEAVTLVNAVLGREPHEDHLLSSMVTWPDNPKSAWYYEDIQEATNSHDYVWASGNAYEIWTELLENRDWAKLEKEWSTAYSAPGGDVMS